MTSDILNETLTNSDGDDADATVVTTPAPEENPESVVAVVPDDVETELAKDTLFELLKAQRRRDAIEFLKRNDGWTTLSDMAEHIAAKENGLPLEGIDSKQRKRVYIGLYQCHLPKLASAGVVDFDKNRGTIQLRDVAVQLYPYLDDVSDDTSDAVAVDQSGESRRVSTQSSLLAGLGVTALAGVAGVPGLELLAPAWWAVVCALALLVTAMLPVVRN